MLGFQLGGGFRFGFLLGLFSCGTSLVLGLGLGFSGFLFGNFLFGLMFSFQLGGGFGLGFLLGFFSSNG